MVKCNSDQLMRLKRALKRETNPTTRQRIQMVLLRENGMTQPESSEAMGASLSTVNRAHMAGVGRWNRNRAADGYGKTCRWLRKKPCWVVLPKPPGPER